MRVTRSKRNLFDHSDAESRNQTNQLETNSRALTQSQFSLRQRRDTRRRNKFESLSSPPPSQIELMQMITNPVTMTRNNFLLILSSHIKPDGHVLRPTTLTGVNLLSQGFAHVMWAQFLKEQDPAFFQAIRNSYYEDYKHTVTDGLQQFEKMFGGCTEKYNMDAESTQVFSSTEVQNSISITDELEPNVEIIQIPDCIQDISNQRIRDNLANKQEGESQQISILSQLDRQYNAHGNKLMSPLQLAANEGDAYLSLNMKLTKQRNINERRLAAEMTCRFLSIPAERTFWSAQVQVETVLESHASKQMQYMIVVGRVKVSEEIGKNIGKINSTDSSHIFISCYRCMKLEQLVRIEMTYGPIFGFIVCDIDSYLVECLTVIQNNNRNQIVKLKN